MEKNKFDNHIAVIDATGKHLNPSYLHRARGLVKNGRAEWVDEKTIRIINSPTSSQSNNQTFPEPLFGKLQAMLNSNLSITEIIGAFVKEVGYTVGAEKAAYRFLDNYAGFCGESSAFAVGYREHICQVFEEPARKAVSGYKKAIVFIPEDTIIDPYFLDGLSNDEFVTVFKALQQLVYGIYEEVERTSPFEWGWQGWQDKAAYGVWHNRIMGLLGAFAEVGHMEGDVLVVNKKNLYNHDIVKKQNQINSKGKTNLIIAGLMDMGLFIEGFDDKKSDTFIVSCPDTPHLITVLCSYYKRRPQRDCFGCIPDSPCTDNCSMRDVGHHNGIFSYRFVEQHPSQTHDIEIFFKAVTDSAPEALRKIRIFLHEEAAKYGFVIMPWTPAHGGSINYWKGPKQWLPVGTGTSWMDFYYTQSINGWKVEAKFERIFKKHAGKADELLKKFPDAYNCESSMFSLQNPTLDDIKVILELYKLENNIKPM